MIYYKSIGYIKRKNLKWVSLALASKNIKIEVCDYLSMANWPCKSLLIVP